MGRKKKKVSSLKKQKKQLKNSYKFKDHENARKLCSKRLRKSKLEHEIVDEENDLCASDMFRVSDRKYVQGNVEKFKKDLQDNNSEDMVNLFGKKIRHMKWYFCSVCHSRSIGFIKKCWCKKRYVLESKLMDVGQVPECLKILSPIEELLISPVYPAVQVHRLKGGQFGYKGHVVNFFQDVQDFARKLPHTIEDLQGFVHVSYDVLNYHKDFRIRKYIVLDALQWLCKNNKFFADVTIDVKSLSSLPCDGYYHGKPEDFVNSETGKCWHVCMLLQYIHCAL